MAQELGASAQILDITVSSEDRYNVVAVDGEIDMCTAPLLLSSMERAGASSQDGVILDLSGVSFLDSSGIQAIVRASKMLKRDERQLVVRNPRYLVRRVFQISGLARIVEIQDTALAG